jgi:hypothetical protein
VGVAALLLGADVDAKLLLEEFAHMGSRHLEK